MALSALRLAAPTPRVAMNGDAALALAVAVFAVLDVVFSGDWRGPHGVNTAVVVALALALAWRRRRPLLVLTAVVVGIGVLAVAYGSSQTWTTTVLVVLATWSAVAHGARPALAAALAGAGAAVHVAFDPAVAGFGDALWSSSLVALVVGAGLTARAMERRSDALDQRAERLVAEAAEVAAAAAAEERGRIARELHDIVAHSLGVLVLQAGAVEQVLDREPERAREVLASMRATGTEAIGEMSTLLGLVRDGSTPSLEPQPSLADVDRLVERAAGSGVDVELVREGRVRPVTAAVELSAFRAVQEGLTNAIKHAPGARVAVVVRFEEAAVVVEVLDDGSGATPGAGARRGLAGLGERVAVFDGRFEAGPRPSGGWRLHVSFPAAP